MNFILEAIKNEISSRSRFIIHEHHADRAGIHFDIRIEKDGVLKSWATKKLPNLLDLSSTKIQLFQTPDHNLEEWIKFKGRIPSGEYGGGTVYIFDKGPIKIIKWDDKSKVVIFNGKKINGKYAIIQPKPNMYIMLKMKV